MATVSSSSPPAAPADVRVQVRLPGELVEWLDRVARSRGIGRSTLVRMLLFASRERRPL